MDYHPPGIHGDPLTLYLGNRISNGGTGQGMIKLLRLLLRLFEVPVKKQSKPECFRGSDCLIRINKKNKEKNLRNFCTLERGKHVAHLAPLAQ